MSLSNKLYSGGSLESMSNKPFHVKVIYNIGQGVKVAKNNTMRGVLLVTDYTSKSLTNFLDWLRIY